MEEEFGAGGDTEVTGAARRGETTEGSGAVRMVRVGGDPNQERDGESDGGLAVVGAHADQYAHGFACRPVFGTQQASGLPGVLPAREVPPGKKVVEDGSADALGPDGRRHSPDVEWDSRERCQIRPVGQSPAHR
ncbi:hypothetical protein [Streptomyces rubrogriseus]|uniref:Uncharacterized protein n=1 Tax=Streptomyces rubrogriseus TaxID=194673 RepID=A0A6G3TCS3_9ACTN|nr:hypothetical protein [Streptomyces rubrogriseus]NEC33821.1 hypothetical protein [Streptomyces rubrogriseus]